MARKRKGKGLSMRKVKEVLRLALGAQMSERMIAQSLSISHVTVGKYLQAAQQSGLSCAEMEKMGDVELLRRLKVGRTEGKKGVRPQPDWSVVHQELQKKGVTIQLLWEEYKAIDPDGYERSQFYKLYARWKGKLAVALRQTHKAGEKMFVDYAGQTVPVIDRQTGQAREAQVFVGVLGASNYTYSEATWIGSHVRAFEYFGGVPQMVVPDNLKAGVSRACRYEPDINPTYHEMSVHYGTVVIPARVRKPRDKAKAEVGVQVVERWILASLRDRQFFSLGELNEAIRELLVRLNSRPFKKLSGSRLSWFETLEKPVLRPLPQSRYVFSQWKKARVNIDYHVELERHYYSVPYQLVQEEVDLRSTATTVEIFHRGKRVASHLRSSAQGHHSTVTEHMPRSHQAYLEWNPSRIVGWAQTVGQATAQVVQKVMESRRHTEQGYRACLGILRLGKRYTEQRLEAASRRAIAIGGYSYRSIASILENGLDQVPLPETKEQSRPIIHDNIRGSEYYG
jgi:transposase